MNPEGLPQGALVALFSTKIALSSHVPTNFFPCLIKVHMTRNFLLAYSKELSK